MTDELGAHVSSSGGCANVHARAAEIGAVALQMFTKQPQRWAEPKVSDEDASAFREQRARYGVTTVVSHASYLPNLATPDPQLLAHSRAAEVAELRRCNAYGIDLLVEHPGNATDGDRERGLRQNALAIGEALEEAGGETIFLLETTAGAGQVLGSTFEELARMLELIPEPARSRVGVCLDTCHVFAAGSDLVNDYDGVMARFGTVIGFEHLKLFHLNDSQGALGSHRDRHAGIGDGLLGVEPFRRILLDERFRHVPKLLETPKGDDPVASDRENLRRLRALRTEG
ncbi:deoxyribonuclease IV [soil metagenome]